MYRHRTTPIVLIIATLACLSPAGNSKADEKIADDQVATAKIKLKQGDRIIFFGDSLTAQGIGPTGYVSLVRNTLQEKYKDLGIEVDAVATGGHTVPQLLERVDRDVIAKKPSIVVIQIGCNDARRLAKDLFKTSLEELIDRLRSAGIQVVQCSLTTVGEKHDGSNKSDPQLEEFAEIERGIARAKKVPLNDLRKAFMDYEKQNNPENKDRGILTNDGNHFNDVGQKFVAAQMLKKFE